MILKREASWQLYMVLRADVEEARKIGEEECELSGGQTKVQKKKG